MGNKVQGEGNYDSARRFNKEEKNFVKKGIGKQPPLDKDEEADGLKAEARGKARARDGGHDAKDADLFRKSEPSRRH